MVEAMQAQRIALLGTRGIPARYGGFETFAEEIATVLAERGHHVTVYARRPFGSGRKEPELYRGVTVRFLPTVMHKYLETPLHALVSFFDLFRRKFDIVLLCNAANSPFAWLVRLRKIPLVINVDGIERKRAKWNWLGRIWYRLGERCSVLFADRVIADAQVIADYYQERYGVDPAVIAYGARAEPQPAGEVLEKFGLRPNGYLLYVSRLEPENNALGVIRAYREVDTEYPLVVVGDAPYADNYIDQLHSEADERVVFTGYQFGDSYQELQTHARLYIQATEVGGTHPALIEAMAYGNGVIANGTPENREVLGEAGLFYEINDFDQLGEIIGGVVDDQSRLEDLGNRARGRAERLYDWERIADQYEELAVEVVGGSPAEDRGK